jgi:glycosyltransferase involved in cell wall biosynthesis
VSPSHGPVHSPGRRAAPVRPADDTPAIDSTSESREGHRSTPFGPLPTRRVVIGTVRTPFVRGGADYQVHALGDRLVRHGYLAEVVSLPFACHPREEILAHAAAWRLLDLSESNGRPIDLAIGTRFPAYCMRHPRKVAWLTHHHRAAAADLRGAPPFDLPHGEADAGFEQRLRDLDRQMLDECRRVLTNTRSTATRVEESCGVAAEVLRHPPRLAGRLRRGPAGNYVVAAGGLDATTRVDLLVRAFVDVDPPLRLVVAGEGTGRDALASLASQLGVGDRIDLAGDVHDEELVTLYAGALATTLVAFDEDSGDATLESFLAHKPVVTTCDSGEPLALVEDGVNGRVCPPEASALAAAINGLAADRARAAALGSAGFERARTITWDGVVESLVASSGVGSGG